MQQKYDMNTWNKCRMLTTIKTTFVSTVYEVFKRRLPQETSIGDFNKRLPQETSIRHLNELYVGVGGRHPAHKLQFL